MAESKRATIIADVDEHFDMRALVRLGAWGLSAVAAVVLVIVAGRSEIGTRRAVAAFQSSEPPAAVVAASAVGELRTRASDSEHETRRLADSIRALNDDRDRLTVRMSAVEREVGDLTGSVSRALAIVGTVKPMPSPETKPAGPDTAAKPPPVAVESKPAALDAAPNAAIVDKTTTPPQPDKLRPAASAQPPAVSEAPKMSTLDSSKMPKPPALQPPSAAAQRTAAANPTLAPAAKPPDADSAPPTGTIPVRVPLPKPLTAATPPAGSEKAQSGERSGPAASAPGNAGQAAPAVIAAIAAPAGPDGSSLLKVEIGLDLGPALTLARLRTRWSELQAQNQALFNGMRPLVALRETSQGKSVELRLVIGPVADIQAAAEVCGALAGSQFMCQPAVFDGQRLGTR
jgi:hypothetical protein